MEKRRRKFENVVFSQIGITMVVRMQNFSVSSSVALQLLISESKYLKRRNALGCSDAWMAPSGLVRSWGCPAAPSVLVLSQQSECL